MLYGAEFIDCSEINETHKYSVCGQNVELLNVKLLVHHVTSRL